MNIVLPDDERFAEFLQSALQDVHTPVPEAPREEIWAVVRDHRRGVRLSAGATPSVPRTSMPYRSPLVSSAPRLVGSEAIENRDPVIMNDVRTVDASPSPINVTSKTETFRRRYAVPIRWALPIAAAALVIGVGLGWQFEHGRTERANDIATTPIPRDLPVQMAAQQHLNEVDKLLATFKAVQSEGSAAAENNALVEAEVALWARDLLATTQLLMDSPLGMDPKNRILLTDIEMILVQIAQLAPTSLPDERDITEQSIEQSQMRERLQQATPSTNEEKKSKLQGL